MTRLLEAGFIDTFRHFYPDRTDAYTWWSFMPKVRQRNIGWRIDYFFVSARLRRIYGGRADRQRHHGQRHCPVGLLMRDPGERAEACNRSSANLSPGVRQQATAAACRSALLIRGTRHAAARSPAPARAATSRRTGAQPGFPAVLPDEAVSTQPSRPRTRIA